MENRLLLVTGALEKTKYFPANYPLNLNTRFVKITSEVIKVGALFPKIFANESLKKQVSL